MIRYHELSASLKPSLCLGKERDAEEICAFRGVSDFCKVLEDDIVYACLLDARWSLGQAI